VAGVWYDGAVRAGRARWLIVVAAVALCGAVASCGAVRPAHTTPQSKALGRHAAGAWRTSAAAISATTLAALTPVRSLALVTAETENRLVVVDLANGQVRRRVALPADPEYVAAGGGVIVVVSASAGAVTLLDRSSLRVVKVLRGFGLPHIPAIAPDGKFAYITDDARGTLTVIRLTDARVVGRISVGANAHHLSFRPDERQVWLALGQSARTIVIVDTANPARPRVVGRFDPGYQAHDLLFTPDGRRIWITSASGPEIGVFNARSHRLSFQVPGGAPPQHVVFDGPYAYVTSGYGGQIEQVQLATGRVLKTASTPYGSFDLAAADGFVVTSSLLRGTLAIYDTQLHRLRVLQIAPAAEDVAILRERPAL
jgi:DNA-binding beta-propeller fold protein YncE